MQLFVREFIRYDIAISIVTRRVERGLLSPAIPIDFT